MLASLAKGLALAATLFLHPATAQQYAGDVINNTLPGVPGSELVYFRITDPAGKNNHLTLTNYQSLQQDGARLDPNAIQRAVIVVHGLDRDPGTYMSNMLSALSQVTSDTNVNFSSVAINAPYFPNGDDKNIGYPWTSGLAAGRGSTTNALVWYSSQWASGANNQYPWNSTTISSFEALDQLVKWYDNRSMFPNMKQIVVAGHSLGGQTINRYAEIGNVFKTNSPVSYWIGNPNSYGWLSIDRPLSTTSCPTFDNWREGFTNFTQYPMSYGTSLVASGRSAVLSLYNSRSKNYARGIQDLGDDSSTCAPFTTGANRNERFFNFISAFPPACSAPGGQCDTVDYINTGHDAGAMFASLAGQARLFLDNFYGTGSIAYDFGYPRQQPGDDPYPNPNLNATSSVNETVYAGNMTLAGCWTDTGTRTLPYMAYDNTNNTIESCTSTCVSLGYSIAGAEFGSQCWCGNALTAYAQETIPAGCAQACAGNSTEVCGGSNRLSIYADGTPSQLAVPGTPEVVGNYNSYQCYTESTSDRALSGPSYTDGTNMTLESCATFCNGYEYFGTEYSTQCFCGSYFNAGAAVASGSDCDMMCSGNSLELCGGPNRLTVYQLTSGASVSVISQGASSTTSTTSSVSSTTQSGSSGTSSSAPASTNLCPSANGQTITDSNGISYTVTCSSDSTQGAYTNAAASNSYLDCMTACDAQSSTGCVGFVYVGGANGSGSGTCWLKTGLGSYTATGSNYIAGIISSGSSSSSSISSSTVSTTSSAASTSSSAAASSTSVSTSASSSASAFSTLSSSSTTLVTSATSTPSAVSCPSANNTIYTASGSTFLIECGIDHSAGDMGMTYVSSFAGCIVACASTTGCVDVSMSGNACYMKSSVGAAIQNGGVLGAKLVTVTSSSSTTFLTTTSATSSSATSSTTASSTTASTTTALTSTSVSSSTASSTTFSTSTISSTTSSSFSSSTSTATSASSSSSAITSSSSTASTASSTTKSSASSTSTSISLPSGISSVGCFVDSSIRALPTSNGSTSTNTPSSCALNCRALGFKYAGTEYSSECWCGNSLPTTSAPSTDCNMACSGDKTQDCGAGNRLSVTADVNWVQTFFARPSYGTWNLMSCYVDSTSARTIPTFVSTSATGGANNMTIANCLNACAASGYGYCGAEYYSECYGGSVAPNSTLVAAGADPLSAGCNFACKGNSTEACGGSNRVLVYVNNGTASN